MFLNDSFLNCCCGWIMFIFVLGTIFNSGAMTVFFALMLVLMIPVWLFSIRKLYEYDRKDRED